MSQLKVNTIRHTGASSDAITLAADGTAALGECTAKITNNLSNRNLVINGAMNVAQRSASSTADGYQTVDRFKAAAGGNDNVLTQAQHALTSSDTGPYELGFRKSLHITNGDQSSGAGAADYFEIQYNIEAQDLANSGWNYTSTSSYITLSFWAQASVAQTYYVYLQTTDGTAQTYSFSFALSANTWTKVTKTIPGAANITFDDNTDHGLRIGIVPFYGTNYTNNKTADTWAAHDGSNYFPDQTSTWWTTDDATFEITGVQLTTTDYCPDYPHVSYAEDLRRCQRYYWQNLKNVYLFQYGETHKRIEIYFPVPMRTTPTYDHTGSSITIDSGTHQSEEFFCAYSASDYDGPGRNYSSVKFNAEI